MRTLVLDEADEMLDMGFAEDLEAILAATPPDRQTALFSATLPPRIVAIAQRHLENPVRIAIAREPSAPGKVPKVRQTAYVVARGHKRAALGRVLDLETPTAALVFCRTRLEVDDLTRASRAAACASRRSTAGSRRRERDRVMKKLRAGTLELVVATDVAARGLDIGHLSHVVNYDVPVVGRTPTSTASAARDAPAAKASRSRSPSRASTGSSRTSSARRSRRSRSAASRPSRTCAPSASS